MATLAGKIANGVTVTRLALVPVMLFLAWRGNEHLFLGVLIYMLLSDIADGQIARRCNGASPLGAKLDSWADALTYFTLPVAAWWMRPDLVAALGITFVTTIVSYATPVAIGFLKFRELTSYHTLLARVAAYLIGVAVVILFARGPIWPFRIAVVVLVASSIEEIGITLILARPHSNVRSLKKARALRLSRE